jgi:hypothetical protein
MGAAPARPTWCSAARLEVQAVSFARTGAENDVRTGTENGGFCYGRRVMTNGPRIAAYLGVKDEVELIERSIAHLRAIGVDYIMACDMTSTDGTAEILEGYRSETFSILTLTNEALSLRTEEEDNWFGQSQRWYRDAAVDWVIFLDADEFWLPASGSLKDCQALAAADLLTVERYNVVLGPDGPLMPATPGPESYDQIHLFAERVPNFRQELQNDQSLPWITGTVAPKIMARPSKIGEVTAGAHGAIGAGTPLRRARPNDLIIAHLALTTRTRFERKVKNIRAIYEGEGIDLSELENSWQAYEVAWHWRRWATLTDIDAEFEHNTTSFDRLEELRGEGIIKSASEILAQA